MSEGRRLEHLKNINQEIRALEDSLLTVRTRLTRISPILSDMPSARMESDSKMINGIAQIIELEKMYNRAISNLVDYEKNCLTAISKIDNSIYRTILIERYINGKDFNQISEIFPYTYNHVCKLHAHALDEFHRNAGDEFLKHDES